MIKLYKSTMLLFLVCLESLCQIVRASQPIVGAWILLYLHKIQAECEPPVPVDKSIVSCGLLLL